MSMERRRFGAGIVAGLILALLIVGSTGSSSGLFASLSPLATQNVGPAGPAESSSSTALVTVATTSSAVTTFSSMSSFTATATTSATSVVYTSSPGGANKTISSVSTQVTTSVMSEVSTSLSTAASNSSLTQTVGQLALPWYDFIFAANSTENGGSYAAAQKAPSRLPAIAAQPAVQSGIVLVPLLVAVILGALLFRASGRGRGAKSKPEIE